METYTVVVMVEHPKTQQMVKQGVGIKVIADGLDQAKKKIRDAIAAKGLPPIRAINVASRMKRHFLAYCAPIAQTKPTPGVDMRWRKPPG
jgi:hypothetical protein